MKAKLSAAKLFAAFALLAVLAPTQAFAHCPACTAATGAAVGIGRTLGVSDLALGSLFAAFTVSTALWFDKVLKKRSGGRGYLPLQAPLILVATTVLTAAGFAWTGVLDTGQQVFGVHALLLGTLAGTTVSLAAFAAHGLLKRANGGKSLVPLQAIILVLLFVAAANVGFHAAGLTG